MSRKHLSLFALFAFRLHCNSQPLLTGRSAVPEARDLLKKSIECSYWNSAHDRIESQFVVWEGEAGVKRQDLLTMSPASSTLSSLSATSSGTAAANGTSGNANAAAVDPTARRGVILPRILTAGTVTRRAVEATWLTGLTPRHSDSLLLAVHSPLCFCFYDNPFSDWVSIKSKGIAHWV